MSKKNCLYILLASILGLLLSACTSPLWDRSPPPSPTTVGFISGAIGGAAIGGAATGGIAIPLGAAIGSMWGGAVGNVISSHQTLVQHLLYSGVQVIRVGDEIRLILPSNRFFKADSANLNPTYYGVLTQVIIFMRAFDKIDVKVAGYTDNLGDWQRDLALSQLQAKRIAFIMWRGQIDARILAAKGYGQQDPIADNSTVKGRAQNRRIEITFRKIEPEVLI